MSARGTLALVAIFAGLATAYWWTGQREAETRWRVFESKRVFDVEADDWVSLSVERSGSGPVEAMRPEGAWRITQPYRHIQANAAAWDRMAAALAALTNERSLDSRLDDIGVYGLDSPALRVLAGREGQLIQVDFGNLDPTQRYRYARISGGETFLAPAGIYEELNKTLLELRDRRVFRAQEEGFKTIVYHAAANAARLEPIDITFEKQTDGRWRITSPIDAAASPRKLARLEAELQLMQGRGYVDAPEHLGDYGLAKPFARVTAYAQDGKAQTLTLGWIDDASEDAGIFVRMADSRSVFAIDVKLITLLPESVDAVRERRLFSREARLLKAITYRNGETEVRLEIGEDGGWRLPGPHADDTDQILVSRFVALLKGIEASSFPDPESMAGIEPRTTMDFDFMDGSAPVTVRLGGPVPHSDPLEYYAWQDSGTPVTVPYIAATIFQVTSFTFRDRRLLKFDPRNATAVDLDLDGVRYRFERDGARWLVAEPAGHYFESQDDALAILDGLAGLQAVKLAPADTAPSVHGLEAPLLRAEVWIDSEGGEPSSAGAARLGNLLAEQSRRRFARVEGNPEIFLADQGIVDDLRGALEGVRPR